MNESIILPTTEELPKNHSFRILQFHTTDFNKLDAHVKQPSTFLSFLPRSRKGLTRPFRAAGRLVGVLTSTSWKSFWPEIWCWLGLLPQPYYPAGIAVAWYCHLYPHSNSTPLETTLWRGNYFMTKWSSEATNTNIQISP